jgi:hypothetical protein
MPFHPIASSPGPRVVEVHPITSPAKHHEQPDSGIECRRGVVKKWRLLRGRLLRPADAVPHPGIVWVNIGYTSKQHDVLRDVIESSNGAGARCRRVGWM